MADAPTRSIYDLLSDATVKLSADNGQSEGTGFFVAPGQVLTCAHVTQDRLGASFAMKASHRGVDRQVLSAQPAGEDLCLLTLPAFEHPCVRLGEAVEPRDPLFWYGYPGVGARNASRGESATAASEGVVVENVDGVTASFIKFAPGAVKPGMSGAPLLDERTGCVCGVVKRTRNADIDQGGLAISAARVKDLFPGLWSAHDVHHREVPTWDLAWRRSGAALWRAIADGPPAVTDRILSRIFEPLVSGRSDGFVGRGFLFRELDAVVADPAQPSGYMLITAEPGLGKTALMAQLVKTRGCVHHFNVTSLDIRSPRQFVENICGQLIVKYGLEPTPSPAAPADLGGYLSATLDAAAAARGDEPVVLLVDAVDEATDDGLPAGANRLFLPRDLPPGVFIVLTSRPLADYRLVVERLRLVPLREDSEDNQRDVEDYIRGFVARHEDAMVAAIADWDVAEDEFVRTLQQRSEGNFMYLKHVLPDLRDRRLDKQSIGDVYSLPAGIREYYRWHWRRTRDSDPAGFESVTKPVICAFATAKEPVTVKEVVRWTRTRWPALDPARILAVVAYWRPFLDEVRPAGEPPRFRVYHASFKNFLEEVEGLGLYEDLIIDSALAAVAGFGVPPAKESPDVRAAS
jgi:hypothetical protein